MSDRNSPSRQRRRAIGQLVQKLQHAVPGGVLLREGLTGIMEGVHGWHLALSVAEVATCAAVFVALVKAILELGSHFKAKTVPHRHLGIDWVDIFLGTMLFTEAWAKYHENGHIKRPTIVLGVVMIILGLFGGKLVAWKARRSHA